MTHPVLLNNRDHKDLRVLTTRGADYGDNAMSALTFPDEFRTLQAHYPIVFQKTQDGTGFQALALLGFEEGENLFLDGERWDAPDLPLTVERQPFRIGGHARSGGRAHVVCHVLTDAGAVPWRW